MSDLIDREALLRQIDIDSEGEPGYYGDTWKFIDTIKSMPPAELGTNLAEVGTDLISRQALLDKFEPWLKVKDYNDGELNMLKAILYEIRFMPSAQPEIIQCKDCKYWDTTWQNDYAPNYHYCPMIDGTHRNDFYCADAERREVTT